MKTEFLREKEKQDVENAKTNVASWTFKLQNLDIAKDPMFQSMSASITAEWNARIQVMEQANKSRQASLTQTGIRLGSRYVQSYEGIITAEERDGIQRVGNLQAQKQSALIKAENAFRTQKWTEYAKYVDMAEKNYNAERNEFDALNKKVIEENKKREEKKEQSNIALYTSALMKKGINDPKDIIIELTKLGISTSAEDLKKATDLFTSEETKDNENIGKIYQSALNMGATQDVLDSILNSTTTVDAYKAAGKYAQNATGIVGEFNAARLIDGYTGSFNDFQTVDANRKAKATAIIDVSGMTSKQNQVFNSISDKLRNSPLMKANDRTIVLKTITDEIKKNPTDGALQLSLIYSFIQALDTYQSAVREGEIGLTQSLLGWMGKLEIYKSNVETEKKILDEKTSLSIAKSADLLIKTIEEGAGRTENDFKAQAKIQGIEIQWNEYRNTVKELNKTPIGVEAMQNEENTQQDIQTYGINNPTAQDSIKQMIKDGKSYLQIKELLGI